MALPAERAPYTCTVQCEWFPESENPPEYRPAADVWRHGEESALSVEMRLFGAAARTAFNRLAEGLKRESATAGPGRTAAEREDDLRLVLKHDLQVRYGLNSRYADDAILKARQIVDSQRKLIPEEIRDTESKRRRTELKRKANERKAARLEAAGRTEEAGKVQRAIRGQDLRLKKLDTKLETYRRHLAEGTTPKVVFGGKTLWRRLCRSRGKQHEKLLVQWWAARRGRLYSRGDGSKGGNPNLRVGYDWGEFSLSVAISHLSGKTGHSIFTRGGRIQERDTMSEAPRVSGRLWVPPKYRLLMCHEVLCGRPYTVELIRGADGRYRAYVSFAPGVPDPEEDTRRGVLGIDLNPHGVALVNLGRDGCPEPWPAGFAVPQPRALGKYEGEFQVGIGSGRVWLHVPELWQARGLRRDYLLGVLVKVVVDVALAVGKPIAREDLDFKQAHDTNRAFNRYSSNFPFSKATEAIDRRARRCGAGVLPVDPAYTSVQGRWCYAGKLGWSVHESAALCIGRRALGYSEGFAPATRTALAEIGNKLEQTASKMKLEARHASKGSPEEGRARAIVRGCRRIRTLIGSDRLLRSNGIGERDLARLRVRDRRRWGQRCRERDGPWSALVGLQRSRWGRALSAGQ